MIWRGWRRRASVGGGGPVRWGDIISFFANPSLFHVHRKEVFFIDILCFLGWHTVPWGCQPDRLGTLSFMLDYFYCDRD